MARNPTLKELRERNRFLRENLKLERLITAEKVKQARLEARLGRKPPLLSRTTSGFWSVAKPTRRVASTGRKPRPRKVARPRRSREFEALHPRGPGGRFARKTPAQKAQPEPLRRWALFLKPAYGNKAYPQQVIVLILNEDPSKMSSEARGAWIRAIRKARKLEDNRLKWLVEAGSGAWLDPMVEPGTWWVERRENLD